MFLGIVGSPRKGQLTDKLVSSVLDAGKGLGIDTEKVYLADYKIGHYEENGKTCPENLNNLCSVADAIILGAPVYWGDINGLTKDFMDTVDISEANGKLAVGIAVAGGTGKGLCSGVQSLYHFFYHRKMRGIEPTPVSRFNFEQSLKNLFHVGRKLVILADDKKPFRNLQEQIEHYEKLSYLSDTPLDEMLLLVADLIKISSGQNRMRAGEEYVQAELLVDQGKRLEAVEHAVKAYELLFF